MKISIALATYNGSAFLADQLNSFLAQTRVPDEIVVSDDASSDSTLEILNAFRSRSPVPVHICANERNEGHRRNFERALSLCTGDLIFISDQDDVWSKEKIATVADVADRYRDHDVFINDAYYADESLVRSVATVLSRVEAVGASSSGHIAGACTAVTNRFLRFVLPFPADDCPQYDVYIHRWANLLQTKRLIRTPLQSWRIHSNSATSGNEMHSSETRNVVARYFRTRDVDSAFAYELKAREYSAMGVVLEGRGDSLSVLPMAPPAVEITKAILAVVAAHLKRAEVVRAGRLSRLGLVARMLGRGQYRHFKGLHSVAKDLLR